MKMFMDGPVSYEVMRYFANKGIPRQVNLNASNTCTFEKYLAKLDSYLVYMGISLVAKTLHKKQVMAYHTLIRHRYHINVNWTLHYKVKISDFFFILIAHKFTVHAHFWYAFVTLLIKVECSNWMTIVGTWVMKISVLFQSCVPIYIISYPQFLKLRFYYQ